ncbi:probable aldehyde oxidase gad-3 [Plutella xylostella]|uniref:probable aldehyde oxidase gad-3 n=1 Tax=Plutella xylostella TaxID=51655 RepID=UPI002032385E|nr:probable aldehyde oxidase gad-3 [Plutella xylostella]
MDRIHFTVNGKKCSVGSEVTSDVTLLDYLREGLELRGTKYMCREGGCGACLVLCGRGDQPAHTVNSCLVSITSCQDWSITTTEEVGNRQKGYSPVQKTLAEHNGTQCGYCSPAWVMNMTGLLNKKGSDLTMLEVENSFASNICRCTGYRPILEAFKTFAKDSPTPNQLIDLEDLHNICKKTGDLCRKESCSSADWCFVNEEVNTKDAIIKIKLKDDKYWYKVYNEKDLCKILNDSAGKSYMLIAGNTGKGAYPIFEYPEILIDISDIPTLKHYVIDQNLVLGAGNTLAECMEIFDKVSTEEGFSYLRILREHLELVAHIPVRNIGTIGGNLMLKHEHNDFPSDPFLLLETVGAMIKIVNCEGRVENVTPREFLKVNMNRKLITNILLPPMGDEYELLTYKIMPRAQNAIARVNAGFLFKMCTINTETIRKATIVYGNINTRFIHARKTEDFLKNKKLYSNTTLQQALRILSDELLTEGYPEETRKAKKKIALGLFYKAILSKCPSKYINPRYASGSTSLPKSRPVSSGTQVYDTNKIVWPLNKPVTKLEALIQCSGEAEYIEDTPKIPGQVFAAFVLSTVPVAQIGEIDTSPAMALPGVIAFYTVKDIPGLNSFTPLDTFFNTQQEEELCDGNVKFHGQPIGIIVAETEVVANRASKLVKINYKDMKKAVLGIRNAMKYPERVSMAKSLEASSKGNNTTKIIKGSTNIFSQFHFTMETQLCITNKIDDSMDVRSSTQWLDHTQVGMARCLKIDENTINQRIRRVGGAFGAKLSRSAQIAIACALVTLKLNRPCRMILPLTTNMKAIGKRLPASSDFEAGVSSDGEIQYLNYSLYVDNGYMLNEPFITIGFPAIGNSYDKSRWDIKDYDTTTDTTKNSWTRAPGTFSHIALTEYIMEQICYELSLDPIDMRLKNLTDIKAMRETIETLRKDAEYDKRKEQVKQFNESNRWKKRGIRFVPLMWPVPLGAYFNVVVSIYHGDGTVVVAHGGVEMGQGINTKAAQVCAYSLEIPLEKVKIKPTNNVANPNAIGSGGSIASEMVCLGVIKCCDQLKQRLEPFKTSNGMTWVDVVRAAFKQNVNLFASYNVTIEDQKTYDVYGATIVEAEVDILTGESQILRVDLLEDVGQSLSPEIDVGQIEGGFIMGQGYWTCEDLVHNEEGELITDRSWNYHVPQARDIPLDFRVYFKRNSYNPIGVLGSKATGEPATCMAVCVAFAIRHALVASRTDSNLPSTTWFNIDGAHTIDRIVLAASTKLEEFLLM